MPRQVSDRNAELGLPPARILGQHPGEWVAILHRKIVVAGKDPRRVLGQARRRAKGEEPRMFHVPTGEVLLF